MARPKAPLVVAAGDAPILAEFSAGQIRLI